MIFTAVPREALDIVWQDVAYMLAKAVATSSGRFHVDDIYRDLENGVYSLWLAIDEDNKESKVVAAITTRIISYPNKKSLAMDWIGGSKMSEWMPVAMKKLTQFAKDCDCTHLEGYGRKAWMRVLKKYNWKPDYIAYKMEIDNG
jgi:hypothetical protein|tara:strand:+ start:126 stop:557 length:432 start_codon:yes stop_codon:yes gene_type:complete